MRNWITIAVIGTLSSSCQSTDEMLSSGQTAAPLSSSAASALAGDMASRLAEQVPPATTPLKMTGDQSEYSVALQSALKGWGYTVVSDPSARDSTAVLLDYSLQGVEGQHLAQVSTPSIAIARGYAASPSGATPASPLSIMQRN